jgi:cell division initiation protein
MKKFTTSFNGYNKEEVNNFVATVAKEYETMLEKLKLQDEEINNLKGNLVRYQDLEQTLNKTILMAEDTSNQIKRMARDEGKTIVDEAKRNASRIVNDALQRCEELERDAEELRRRVITFKRKFKQAIEAEVEVIDEIADKY